MEAVCSGPIFWPDSPTPCQNFARGLRREAAIPESSRISLESKATDEENLQP